MTNGNQKRYLKICSRCGNTNITPYTKLGLSYGEHLTDYCKDCYYGFPSGGFFPEIADSNLEDFRKRLKKK